MINNKCTIRTPTDLIYGLIFCRTFNYYAHFFLWFSVYVSNTPDISQGKLCFKDTNFTLNTIPAVFTTACLLHGQYVIFHNEREQGVAYPNGYSEYARTDLCEVEVFGMCFF